METKKSQCKQANSVIHQTPLRHHQVLVEDIHSSVTVSKANMGTTSGAERTAPHGGAAYLRICPQA